MARTRVKQALAALVAVFTMACIMPFAGASLAHAEDAGTAPATHAISADDLSKAVELKLTANESIQGHQFTAYRLADYVAAKSDGSQLLGVDVTTTSGYATAVADAIKNAGIATTNSNPVAYDATNPMPWVISNLLQASKYPYADDNPAQPNLRAFLTNLVAELNKISAPTAGTTYDMTIGSDNKSATATVIPGAYVIWNKTPATTGTAENTTDTPAADKASIPMFNGTGIYDGETLLTTLKDSTNDQEYTLGSVEYKVSQSTLEKKVLDSENKPADATTASIGDELTFTLSTTVPNWTGYDHFVLKIADNLSKGLKFGATKSVVVGNTPLVADESYKVNAATTAAQDGSKSVEWIFAPKSDGTSDLVQNDKFKGLFSVGAKIVVTYTAYLTKDAVINSTGNPNSANVQYSHNPNDSNDLEKSPDDTVKVYTGQFSITKNDMESHALAGAKFQIFKSTDTTKPLKFVADTVNDTYRLADADEEQANRNLVADNKLTSPQGGKFTITGLAPGSYIVKETDSPFAGGNLFLPEFTTTLRVTAPEPSDTTGAASVSTIAGDNGDSNNLVTVANDNATVKNPRNLMQMPKTGAAWLAIYAVMAVLFISAGFILVWRSRRQEQE
ncbi:hypothetical protein GCM10007377_11650 [Galliscardovia ingluviei]|uniref:SpaA-like prealbumin fold domain-containing protein n=1 Tax=Galliscardovia ingluviei TaxID=1769422 RepID=A0A8J3EZM0_9BIFI|nr:isopeptide-forming domain-containing fimbrial protein [Galliscardovia ingluviei]GGI14581.1 hypothetical protein GCM10007377_11650 [Galliscardovia ingluviei]